MNGGQSRSVRPRIVAARVIERSSVQHRGPSQHTRPRRNRRGCADADVLGADIEWTPAGERSNGGRPFCLPLSRSHESRVLRSAFFQSRVLVDAFFRYVLMTSSQNKRSKAPAPIALVVDLWRYRSLLWQFTLRNVELRHKGSHLGLVWSFLNPLLMLALYVLVFGYIFRGRFQTEQEPRIEYALVMF